MTLPSPLTEAELIARSIERCERVLAGTDRRTAARAVTETPVQRQAQRAQAKG